jgi:tetratricopeptide (TPR) repeat protein
VIVQLFAEKTVEGSEVTEKIGEYTIDKKYFVTHRRPYFRYKFPLRGKKLSGRKLQLSFAIASFNPDGSLKEYFCESQTKPFGPIKPACCSMKPWEGTQLQSIVEIPKLEVSPDTFVYRGFDATFDVTFKEGAFTYPDGLLAQSLQGFIEKYKALNYEVRKIDLRGYASPGGSESANQRLSERRAQKVFDALTQLNADQENLRISHKGAGEDWLKVEELVTRSPLLTKVQRDEVITIIQSDRDVDGKEREMKRLDYWKTLDKEVFATARHTFVNLSFEYIGTESSLGRYSDALQLGSSEMDKIAQAHIHVGPYSPGMDEDDKLATLNEVLREKATANLYAMRATYHLAKKDFEKLYEDLKSAAELDPDNEVYSRILTGYKIRFAEEEGTDRMTTIYEEINAQTRLNPKDRSLFLNRAILLEKMGRIEDALEEYRLLFDGVNPAPPHINNRGVARLKSNRIREAESDFLLAINRNSKLAEPHFNLAAIYAYRGFTSRSLTYLDRAIDRDPRFKDMIFNNPVFSVVSEDPKYDKYR